VKRGGKRFGAGRPVGSSVLDALEMIALAAECERRWHEDSQQRLVEQQAAYFARSDYDAATSRVRQALREGRRDAEAIEDVEFARREMAGIDADDAGDGPRVLQFWVAPKRGLRKQIEADAANWASSRFGKSITPRMVRTVWANFRRSLADD
jgi:hypothetical protein